MSKKLLIAVLVFGFTLALSGAVIGYDDTRQDPQYPAVNFGNPNGQSDDGNVMFSFPQIENIEIAPENSVGPVKHWPPDYYCEFIDYSGSWVSYGEIGGFITHSFMRHTAAKGYSCSLQTVYIAVYPGAFVGDPDMLVGIWDDDGSGFPGSLLGSVTVPFASLPTSMGYSAAVDVSTLDGGGPFVFEDGENYHIAAGPLDVVNDVLAILMDDGTNISEQRQVLLGVDMGWYAYGGGGTTIALGHAVDVCCGDIPFSNCFTQSDWVGFAVYTQVPDESYDRKHYSQRFTTSGADTLKEIRMAVYFWEGIPDLKVDVLAPMANGYPDTLNVLYTATVLNADLIGYLDDPGDWVYVSGIDLVLPSGEDFYVHWMPVINSPGDSLAGLADNASNPGLRSAFTSDADSPGTHQWYYYGEFFTTDRNLLIEVDLCASEFDICEWQGQNDCDPAYVTPLSWWIPSESSSIDGKYKEFAPFGAGCQLQQARVYGFWYGATGNDYNVRCKVYETDGVTLLGEVVMGPGEFQDYPAWNYFDLSGLNIKYDQPVWVGFESDAPVSEAAYDVAILTPDGCADGTLNRWSDGWYTSSSGSFIEVQTCCIKPPERDCGPPEDWAQGAQNSRRTAASQNSTGDAQNMQDVLWRDYQGSVTTPGLSIGVFGRPIIYDTVVVVPYADRLVAYGVNGNGTGGPNIMWTISGSPYIGLASFSNSPLAHDGYVYFGGAAERSFQRADIYTGVVGWSHNKTLAPPYEELSGNTDYTIPILLDIEGTEVVFFTTHIGEVYAFEAATGAFFTGWTTNPVMVDGDPKATLSSNGVDVLYVGTDGTAVSGDLYGTLYALNAADGTVIWTLEEEDMYGEVLDEDTLGITTEIFQGPISVDHDGTLFFMCGFDTEGMDSIPSAVYYSVDNAGNIIWGVQGKFPRFTGVIIDAAKVYYTSLAAWIYEHEAIDAFDKFSGANIWTTDTVLFKTINWVEGALDCRPLEADLIYQPNMDYRFMVVNSDDGSFEFEYTYFDSLIDRGAGTAIGKEHVIMTNRNGDVFCFAIMDNRPRLRFLKFDQFAPVEPTTYHVVHEDAFMNNGGANLLGSITADEIKTDSVLEEGPLAVDPNYLQRVANLADAMVEFDYDGMTGYLHKNRPVEGVRDVIDEIKGYDVAQSSSSVGAYGWPSWLTAFPLNTFDVAPGGTFDVEYDVEPTLVTRGPHRLYCTFSLTNEDYYINSPDRDPIVNFGIIGGCLEVDDVIHFGDAGGNAGPVFNTSQIGNQSVQHWDIDGVSSAYWQGAVVFGASKFRIAFNCESWSGADPDDFWNSILPDANLYGTCPPEQTDMVLGRIWNDGTSSYDDVNGHVFQASYIDSVIDFNCESLGWAWDNVHCGYDNTLTIGLKVDEWTYGAEHAALGNFVIKKLKVTNRNATPLTDIGIGAMNDYDMQNNGLDVFYFNEDYAICYGQSCNHAPGNNTYVYGTGSIPYDAPAKQKLFNVHTMDAQQGAWHDDYIFMDSLYWYMRNQTGQTAQVGIDMNIPCNPASESDDRDVFMGYDFRDYDGYGEAIVGWYFFGFASMNIVDDEAYFPEFAVLVNQWAGFGRGDIDRDNVITLSDLVALFNLLHAGGDGPLFEHLADVDADDDVNDGDLLYMVDYWFGTGPAPVGAWVLPETPLP